MSLLIIVIRSFTCKQHPLCFKVWQGKGEPCHYRRHLLFGIKKTPTNNKSKTKLSLHPPRARTAGFKRHFAGMKRQLRGDTAGSAAAPARRVAATPGHGKRTGTPRTGVAGTPASLPGGKECKNNPVS